MRVISATVLLAVLVPGSALAQDKALERAGEIATQPVRDVGIDRKDLPKVLQEVAQDPYAPPANPSCRGLNLALGELNAVLGEDFGVGVAANEDRSEKIAEAVGRTIVNSLVPFRGLVREISGAAPAERRLEAAVTIGIARRGYLRGLARAKGCKIAPVAPLPPGPSPPKTEGK